ncbi:MAG: hypothetical protein WC379_17775 [Methanoregula sp.]|jgi:hypothetical protein
MVKPGDTKVWIPYDDRYIGIIDKILEILVGLLERFLCPLTVGDVLNMGDEIVRLPFRIF